ncbi:hypothetical protein BD779DRAFT_1565442 [Infundibulicybe gibba]|nr:hypothetical protein BD779DRAFT_1565442 [Infundibulicybe gibba]
MTAQPPSPAPSHPNTAGTPRLRFIPASKATPDPAVGGAKGAKSGKGVQDITRKLVLLLQEMGMGHVLDLGDAEQEGECENENESERGGSERGQQQEQEQEQGGTRKKERGERQPQVANGHAGAVGGASEKRDEPQKKKIDWEIPRKVLHSSIGFGTLYLYASHQDPGMVIRVLWSALAVIAPAEIMRFRSQRFGRLYQRCLGFLMRESEKTSTNGVIWYIIGVNTALTFYPLDIAVVAILILSWADTAASTVGRLCSSFSPALPARLPLLRLPLAPRKSLAGFLAAAVTGAGVAVGLWGWVFPVLAHPRVYAAWTWDGVSPHGGLAGWGGLAVLGAVAGLVSAVVEALDLGALDDNLTLPILAGACIWGFIQAVRWGTALLWG